MNFEQANPANKCSHTIRMLRLWLISLLCGGGTSSGNAANTQESRDIKCHILNATRETKYLTKREYIEICIIILDCKFRKATRCRMVSSSCIIAIPRTMEPHKIYTSVVCYAMINAIEFVDPKFWSKHLYVAQHLRPMCISSANCACEFDGSIGLATSACSAHFCLTDIA